MIPTTPIKVQWLKKVHTRTGTDVERIIAQLVCADENFATIETADGKRHAVPTADLRFVKETT